MSASEADEDERCGRCEPLPSICRGKGTARCGGCISARAGSPSDARLLLACGALPTTKLFRARGEVARAG
ncbi:hypothetical protein AAT19DRAFT_10436 [Rhodotorula toruloides]|uniref:Uncharacterized protein n=1 Tax=Rhodotorula toruloides TaxID=5286 RepID=A0A2T0A0M5_RHOTO|nr:hypothetical protein AAT19DRAFT_10436 [Rhodotorula toruloides]